MANIRAVSKLAGVSVATVSRSFSEPEKVAATTRQRVMDAAKSLNYKPNSFARLFRSRQTNTVVVVVPNLSNSFFASILAGIESVAAEAGFSLLLSNAHDNPEVEKSCVEQVETKRADGVIQLGARSLEEIVEDPPDIPFVHAIEQQLSSSHSGVRIDDEKALAQMTNHLLEIGHRRIGIVAGREDSLITQNRLAGALKACKAAGLNGSAIPVAFAPYSVEGGQEAASTLLKKNKDLTALICMSDYMAIGAIKAARQLGLSVPGDISVTGFDNIEVSDYIEPGLTTVTQPAQEMGELAMKLLLERLANPTVEPKQHVLEAKLILRDSVAPPKR